MTRPTSVTVIGILHIVFGGMGVICVPVGMFFLAVLPALMRHAVFAHPLPPVFQEENLRSGLMAFNLMRALIVSIALIVAGIGLLRMKSWGRILSIIYGVYGVLAALVVPLVAYHFMPRAPNEAEEVGRAIGVPIGICCAIIYPVVVLIVMLAPSVAAAFRGSALAPPPPPPPPKPPIFPPGA